VTTLTPTLIVVAPISPAFVRSRSVMTGASNTSPTPTRESLPVVIELVAPAATPRSPPTTLLRSPMLTVRDASTANWVTVGTGTVRAAVEFSPSGTSLRQPKAPTTTPSATKRNRPGLGRRAPAPPTFPSTNGIRLSSCRRPYPGSGSAAARGRAHPASSVRSARQNVTVVFRSLFSFWLPDCGGQIRS